MHWEAFDDNQADPSRQNSYQQSRLIASPRELIRSHDSHSELLLAGRATSVPIAQQVVVQQRLGPGHA